MKTSLSLVRSLHFRPLLRVSVMLAVLAWSSSAFCGPIHDAARDGDLASVKTLVGADPSLVNNRDAMGRTPLYWAARAGRKDVVAFLLASNADPNAKDNIGSTPLSRAAYSGYMDVAEMLLAHGADVNIGADSGGFTPMDMADREGHPDMVQFLQQHGGKMMHPRPTSASGQGSAGSATSTPPSTPSHPSPASTPSTAAPLPGVATSGSTRLFDAIEKHDAGTAKDLIANGADVNSRNADGAPALVLAAELGDIEIAKILLQAGAQIDARDQENNATALFWAAIYGRVDIAQLLVDKGADLSVKAKGGVAPLFAAVLGCQKAPVTACVAVADLLLKKGADVNVTTEEGITPFMYASGTSSTPKEMVDFLQANGGRLPCPPDISPLICATSR